MIRGLTSVQPQRADCGVLANDLTNGAVISFPTTSTAGGAVNGNNDGSFTYTPPANFTGTDSFNYQLENSAGISTATVTITVNPVNGFFVDAVNGSNSTGNFNGGQPFQTIQAALAVAPAGSDVVVRPGSYSGTVTLDNGDRLLGSGSALVSAQGDTRPVLTGSINLANGNTVDFFRVQNAPGRAINATGQTGGTITNCEIDTTSAAGSGILGIPIAGGTWVVENNSIANVSGSGVVFTTEGTSTAVVRINNNTITGSAFNGIGFITSNSSNLKAQITGNILTGNQDGFTFEVIAGQTSISCYDIENNTNDDTYNIGSNSGFAGTLQVEEWDNLIAVNNNSGTKTTSLSSSPPASVADGTCGF